MNRKLMNRKVMWIGNFISLGIGIGLGIEFNSVDIGIASFYTLTLLVDIRYTTAGGSIE